MEEIDERLEEFVDRAVKLANIEIYIRDKNPHLHEFLKEKNALILFLSNVLGEIERQKCQTIENLLYNDVPYIITAFSWSYGPERDGFWNELNEEYRSRNYDHIKPKIDNSKPLEFYYT